MRTLKTERPASRVFYAIARKCYRPPRFVAVDFHAPEFRSFTDHPPHQKHRRCDCTKSAEEKKISPSEDFKGWTILPLFFPQPRTGKTFRLFLNFQVLFLTPLFFPFPYFLFPGKLTFSLTFRFFFSDPGNFFLSTFLIIFLFLQRLPVDLFCHCIHIRKLKLRIDRILRIRKRCIRKHGHKIRARRKSVGSVEGKCAGKSRVHVRSELRRLRIKAGGSSVKIDSSKFWLSLIF